jgi:hypothetical protein
VKPGFLRIVRNAKRRSRPIDSIAATVVILPPLAEDTRG